MISGFVVARKECVLGLPMTKYLVEVPDFSRPLGKMTSQRWVLFKSAATKFSNMQMAEASRTKRTDYVETV